MVKISAFIPVFNEESRIKYALTSLKWCDEVVVLDKSSTDNTVNIAKEFGAKVIVVENSKNYSASEFDYIRGLEGDWVIFFTASDLMDVSLSKEIRKVVETLPKDVTVIKLPFHQEVLGINDKRSPWGTAKWRDMIRKDSIKINYNGVHGALSVTKERDYFINPKCGFISHLTHVSVDMMLERHIRYWRTEGKCYEETSLWPAFRHFLRSIKDIIKFRTLLMGWDGIAMTFAYVSYYMLSFLYCWEKMKNGAAKKRYNMLREKSIEDWENYK